MQSSVFEQSMQEYCGGLQEADWHPYYTPQGFTNAFINNYQDRATAPAFPIPRNSSTHPIGCPLIYGDSRPSEAFQLPYLATNIFEARHSASTNTSLSHLLLSTSMQQNAFPPAAIKHEEDLWPNVPLRSATFNDTKASSAPTRACSNDFSTSFPDSSENLLHGTACTTSNCVKTKSLLQADGNLTGSTENNEKRHSHLEPAAYKCDECSRSYVTSRSLAVHKRSHSGEKPYSCNLCSKRFNHWNIWSMHMKAHAGTKEFVCPLCHKAFSQSGHLFTHMQNHQNIKKHACDICKKRFIGKGDLIRHQRSHTGEKPFSCCQCTRRFSRKESLKYHLFLHDDVRPHNCPLCAKSYTKISTLKTHFKKVHNVGDLDSFITHRTSPSKTLRQKAKKLDQVTLYETHQPQSIPC